MINENIHKLIPFNKLLKLLFGIAFTLQLVVITYNHLSGYYEVNEPAHFLFRLFWGTVLSMMGAFLIAYPDLYIIEWLNRRFPWNRKIFKRILIQLGFTVLFALFGSTIITSFSHLINPYNEGLISVLISNGLIFSVANLIMMIILEAWIFFMESTASKKKTEDLEKELSQIRFEVLKNQINPHFLFNSLNVLSGLIEKDRKKAQEFIDEFSHIYRYVLESIEKPLVTINEELHFVRSYMFLQQIRYGNNLNLSIELPADILNYYLPPLSLQVVLENVIKHNQISSDKPLKITITSKERNLLVRNNIQPKISGARSMGIGQQNLVKRYVLISNHKPEFKLETTHYQVTLPLLKAEDYEYTNH